MAVDEDHFRDIRFIGGVDQAFFDKNIISGIVVLECQSHEVVERVYSILPVTYPYIPTFLSFREGQVIVSAYRKLEKQPDMLMVDGAGLNHQRRAGLATPIGVALDVPTIGITKKILCGKGVEPLVIGEANPLIYEGKITGLQNWNCAVIDIRYHYYHHIWCSLPNTEEG